MLLWYLADLTVFTSSATEFSTLGKQVFQESSQFHPPKRTEVARPYTAPALLQHFALTMFLPAVKQSFPLSHLGFHVCNDSMWSTAGQEMFLNSPYRKASLTVQAVRTLFCNQLKAAAILPPAIQYRFNRAWRHHRWGYTDMVWAKWHQWQLHAIPNALMRDDDPKFSAATSGRRLG